MLTRAFATAAVAALAVAACGEEREPGGRAASTSPTPAAERPTSNANVVARVAVSLEDYRLVPGTVRVARPGVIAFVATNDGQAAHALEVDGPTGEETTARLRPGEQGTITVRLVPGTYRWLCPLADHEERGMVGRVRVAE